VDALIEHLKRIILPFLTIVVLSSFLFEINMVSAQPFAYVVNQGSGDVSVIDTATNMLFYGSPIPVGSFPMALAITPEQDDLLADPESPMGRGRSSSNSCALAGPGAAPSIPLYLLIPAFILISRFWRRRTT